MDNSLAEILGKLVALESKVEKLSIDSNSQQCKTNYGLPKPPNKGNGVASKSRQRRTKKTDRSTNTKEPVVVQKSNNPDFAIVTKGVYKHVQLAKAQLNWGRGVPKAIVKQVESVFAFISLPMADDELSAKFKQLMDSTLNSIVEISNCHLEKKQDQDSNLVSHCKSEDKNRAAAVAAKYIGKQFRTKPEKEFLDRATAKAVSVIGTKINVPQAPAESDMETETANKKAKVDNTVRKTVVIVSSSPEPQIKKGKFITEASGKSDADENTEVSAMDTIVPQVNDRTESSPEVNDKTFSVNKDVGPGADEEAKEPRDLTVAIKLYKRIHGLHTKISDLLGKREEVEEDLARSKHNLVQATTVLKGLEIRKQTRSEAFKTEKAQILAIQTKIKHYQDSLEAIDGKLSDAEATEREVRLLFAPYKDIELEVKELLLQ